MVEVTSGFYRDLAERAEALGQWEDALRCYRKALELFPSCKSEIYQKGRDRLTEKIEYCKRMSEADNG